MRELQLDSLPWDDWWPGVARLLARSVPQEGLRDLTVVVDHRRQIPELFRALAADLPAGAARLLPRCIDWEDATRTLVAARDAQLARSRLDYFCVLRDSDWLRQQVGPRASAMWALARAIADTADELTLAALDGAEALERRWMDTVERHFQARALRGARWQSQLVLRLWRADPGAGGSAPALIEDSVRDVAARCPGAVVVLLPEGALPWQRLWCERLAALSSHPVTLVQAQLAPWLERQRWISLAWPEIAGTTGVGEAESLRARAARLGAGPGGQGLPPLKILRTGGLEPAAQAAAHWVLAQRHGGSRSIALIGLDRVLARRTRALLERVGIVVADESGWKLSTTSAASALMRWLDLAGRSVTADALLDALRSPFLFPDLGNRAPALAALEAALVAAGVRHGADAILRAVRHSGSTADLALDWGALPPDDASRRLGPWLEGVLARLAAWPRRASPAQRFAQLQRDLSATGLQRSLRSDAVGVDVLRTLTELEGGPAVAEAGWTLTVSEFRALIAEQLEQTSVRDPGKGTGVCLTTLAGARLRRFDAVLLLGAGAEHLPGQGGGSSLMSDAVRRELGLPDEAQRRYRLLRDLALLLTSHDQCAALWCHRAGAEPRPLSAWLDRLAWLARLGTGSDILLDPGLAMRTVQADPGAARAVAVPGRFPARLSPSAYQDLIDCPYRFFVRRVLGLREADTWQVRASKRDFGDLLHTVLWEFHRDPDAGDASQAAQERLTAIALRVCRPLLEQQPSLIAYRERLLSLIPGYVAWWEDQRRTGWRWAGGEMPRTRDLEVGARPGPAGAGRPLVLAGRIDRIDRCEGDAEPQWRILDYKSADRASLRRKVKVAGEDVQLAFYALLAPEPVSQAAYVAFERPRYDAQATQGVVTLVAGSTPLQDQARELAAHIARTVVAIDAGVPLPANGSEPVCQRCEAKSLCRLGHVQRAAPEAGTP